MEERPRVIKPVREISIKDMPEDLQPFATKGMEYIIKSDGTDASRATWNIDKYLLSLSTEREPIEVGTEVVFI